MKWLNKPFHKKNQCKNIVPIPAWNTVVEMLYDKGLDSFFNEVIKVFYSVDKSMRYVILKNKDGNLTYELEEIYQFDENEWQYIHSCENALPGTWVSSSNNRGTSFFNNENDLMNELKSEPEYRQFFSLDGV